MMLFFNSRIFLSIEFKSSLFILDQGRLSDKQALIEAQCKLLRRVIDIWDGELLAKLNRLVDAALELQEAIATSPPPPPPPSPKKSDETPF